MKRDGPELWTFSGINSWSAKTKSYEDYVGAFMLAHFPARPPVRRYASRLGTTSHYTANRRVLGFGAKRKLDREARELAQGEGDRPPIPSSLFRGKTVKVLLVAPKTNTPPPNVPGLCVEIYWAPFDPVPNQRLGRYQQWNRYARGEGHAWPVSNPRGSWPARGHGFEGFMRRNRMILRRTRRQTGRRSGVSYVWTSTGRYAPDALDTLAHWLSDEANDYVLVAHSQGTNIAMHALGAGYGSAGSGILISTGR